MVAAPTPAPVRPTAAAFLTPAPRFAERADVRYTADAHTWCAVALGLTDPRDAMKQGRLTKDGGKAALDHYFYQPSQPMNPAQLDRLAPQQEDTT